MFPGIYIDHFPQYQCWLTSPQLTTPPPPHPLEKMAVISQTIYLDAFSWMERFVFWLKFHWSLFPRVQLTITSNVLDNGLVPNRSQSIWTTADQIHWFIYAALDDLCLIAKETPWLFYYDDLFSCGKMYTQGKGDLAPGLFFGLFTLCARFLILQLLEKTMPKRSRKFSGSNQVGYYIICWC